MDLGMCLSADTIVSGRIASTCLTVIVPVWNERATVEGVIKRVRFSWPSGKQIVVVDDGSTDGTGERLRAVQGAWGGAANCPSGKTPPLADFGQEGDALGASGSGSEASLVVLRHERRRGKGSAIRTAIPYCRGAVTIIQDADLEYDPSEYPRLVRRILEGLAEVVYGSRFRGSVEGMAWSGRLANRFLTWLANVLYDAGITDEATCYKVFRTELLQSLPLRCRRFEFCPEVTALIRQRGIRIHEVPISYKPRTRAEGKKIRWYDFLEAAWTLIKHRFINDNKSPATRHPRRLQSRRVLTPVQPGWGQPGSV